MKDFNVNLKKVIDDSYKITVGWDLFDTLINDLKGGLVKNVNKYAVITDSTVAELYADKFYKQLKKKNFTASLFIFPAGETSKTRETKIQIENSMIEQGFGRDSCIIALGGGVVSDLAGFIAGTYARGIPFINYATTLLAAADASIGGKTAVDTPHATNLIGLFHQPKRVYIDLNTWKTLSKRHIRNGLVETIKHAIIADYEFFKFLEANIDKVLSPNKELWEHIAFKNCEIKYNVVQSDELENNFRQVLNLGHTAGRALEALCQYKMYHGEAVAIGLVIQLKFGLKFGYITQEEAARVVRLLKRTNLPVDLPSDINKEHLVKKIYTDKKVRKNKIKFVFQKGIGNMMRFPGGGYSRFVEENEILSVLSEHVNL